jgi:hypothetical protein
MPGTLNSYLSIIFLGPLLLLVGRRRLKGKKRYVTIWLLVSFSLTTVLTGCGEESGSEATATPTATEIQQAPVVNTAGPTTTATQTATANPTSTATSTPTSTLTPTATCTSTPTATSTPTGTPIPPPTLPPNIEWLPNNFTITHYSFALESDPRYENDKLVSVPGLPENVMYKRNFIWGDRGIIQQGTGLAEDGQYITINHLESTIDFNNPTNNKFIFTYGNSSCHLTLTVKQVGLC